MAEFITIGAYAADTLGETLTAEAPAEWHPRIAALSTACSYGPAYRRAVPGLLADMSRNVRDGYTAIAYDFLLAAERCAGPLGGVVRTV